MLRQWMVATMASALTLSGVIGCASATSGDGRSEPLVEPDLVALSTYDAELGTVIELYGENFVSPDRGESYLVFDGMFDAADGTSEAIEEAEFELRYEDPGTLLWESFGPFRVPFGSMGNKAGVFYGDVWVRTVLEDGTVIEDPEPLSIREFNVRPSLIVHELQPTTATCAGPVKRGLGGAPYEVSVEAVGFEPESFTYTLSIASNAPEFEGMPPMKVRHLATGKFDSVGERGDFVFPQVPENLQYYTAQLTIEAKGTDGEVRASSFAIGVHRPIEVFYNGNVQVAEIFEPQPVSGCIPGGEIGRDVTYTENTEETRTRSQSVSWSESFLSSHTVSEGSEETIRTSEVNGVGYGVTEGNTVTWEVGGNPGKIHLGKLGAVGFDIDISRSEANSTEVENTVDSELGLEQSETTTNSESLTEEEKRETAETVEQTISSTEVIGTDFGGTVLPKAYGVFYRQTLRLVRRGLLVTYNQCGAAEVVGDYDVVDWTWSPDLAQGNQCPPLPESNLPSAECLISPCAGDE